MKKKLPTGEEPKKGFESVMDLGADDDSLRINSVFISQLASVELSEIRTLRAKALGAITTLTGLADETMPFEHEMDIIPNKSESEKLIFRAYLNKELVGLALVIIGWPTPCEWVIQHLLVDPDQRNRGIGSSIISAVEEFTIQSEVETVNLFAIPIQKSGTEFWDNLGYDDATPHHHFTFDNVDHELIIYRKKLPLTDSAKGEDAL